MSDYPADPRREYGQAALNEDDVDPDPIRQFERWFAEARGARLAAEPNAMTLATATPDGTPSARIVLLKGVDGRGFVFFTDYRSRKGRELEANPRAALVLYWAELERQVRVEGTVTHLTRAESDAYFQSRPVGSRIGAWTSHQSQPIVGREILERRYQELTAQYGDGLVPLPPHWGGYRLAPVAIEFWQGRASRLHDRIRYARAGEAWRRERLSP